MRIDTGNNVTSCERQAFSCENGFISVKNSSLQKACNLYYLHTDLPQQSYVYVCKRHYQFSCALKYFSSSCSSWSLHTSNIRDSKKEFQHYGIQQIHSTISQFFYVCYVFITHRRFKSKIQCLQKSFLAAFILLKIIMQYNIGVYIYLIFTHIGPHS